jgi:transcriptional regulator with GAF, ATPase, and Fis domain
MDLNNVEKQRSGLVQFLVVLLSLILGFILVISWQQDQGYLTVGLTVLGLLTCLYVIGKERGLRRDHDHLVREIAAKRQQVDSLGERLKAEKDGVLKLESRLQELTALYRAISTVNAVTEQTDTFDAVLRAALDLVGGDRGSLMLVDSDGQRLSFATAIGLDETALFGPGPKMGEGVAGWVASNAEPVLITGDADEDAPYEKLVELNGQMNVAISVPLQLGESVIGVLNLGSTIHADKTQFSQDELRFAYIFAQHAAIAVDRAIILAGLKPGSGHPLSEELKLSDSQPLSSPATTADH